MYRRGPLKEVVVISDAASGVLPEPNEGTQQSAGNLTAALPRRPVTCDEGQSHDRNSFSLRVFTGYDYRHSRSCTILNTDHFGCRLRHSARQIFNCSSNALGIPETIFPSPDSPRTCIPSLISSSSDSGRLLQAWRWFQETVRGRLLVS